MGLYCAFPLLWRRFRFAILGMKPPIFVLRILTFWCFLRCRGLGVQNRENLGIADYFAYGVQLLMRGLGKSSV